MRKIFFILGTIILILVLSILYKKHSTSNIIIWSEDLKLKPEDFTKIEKLPNGIGVTIYSSIKYDLYTKSKRINIYAFMDKTKSKRLLNHNINERILTHEFYHFKITEYFARLLRKEIIKIDFNKINKNVIKQKMHPLEIKLKETHEKYDYETKHGENFRKQLKWQQKIDSLLIVNDSFKFTSLNF